MSTPGGAGTIHVVGLGPGRASLLTAETHSLLEGASQVLLRTRQHPTVSELDPLAKWESCDDLYAASKDFHEVYLAVAARVLERAEAGSVIFAVPGNPLVAEKSVALVLAAATERGIRVRVYPALSYVDVAAVALGRELGDVQLCDALALRIDAQRPALISQVFDRDTATAVKLALLDIYPADHTVILLRELGTSAQSVVEIPLAEVDFKPLGYLDTLFVPALAPLDDVRRFEGLWHVIQRLHAPEGGCPWDLEQTHRSLRPHLLEESYEVLEAIDAGDPERLAEELGDLLLQVLMHAGVAIRLEEFELGDITEKLARKLIHRHPHVFGDGAAKTAEDVRQSWEQLKQQEKPRESILEGVPSSLPALAASQTIQGRAGRVGFDWPDIEGPLEKLLEEIGEFAHAEGELDREDEFGDILFVLANIGQRLGIDAEQALRGANDKFRRRFGKVESLATAEGLDLKAMDLAALDALWDRAKAILAAEAGPGLTG